jgi:hypothetical protein
MSLPEDIAFAVFPVTPDIYVSSHFSPFLSMECIMMLTSPTPAAVQYIPFHEIRFTTRSLVSVFAIPVHMARSGDHAIEFVFKSFVGDPSPPTIQTVPFHIIE